MTGYYIKKKYIINDMCPEHLANGHLANGHLAKRHLAKGHLAIICGGDISPTLKNSDYVYVSFHHKYNCFNIYKNTVYVIAFL